MQYKIWWFKNIRSTYFFKCMYSFVLFCRRQSIHICFWLISTAEKDKYIISKNRSGFFLSHLKEVFISLMIYKCSVFYGPIKQIPKFSWISGNDADTLVLTKSGSSANRLMRKSWLLSIWLAEYRHDSHNFPPAAAQFYWIWRRKDNSIKCITELFSLINTNPFKLLTYCPSHFFRTNTRLN